MEFQQVADYMNTIEVKDRDLERKKESLRNLYKDIQKDEAKLNIKKEKALKIFNEINALENKSAN